MPDNRERLLEYLLRADGWVTAHELADRLGVTTRSVRSYVTAVKGQAAPLEPIESSANGYRLDRDAYAAFVEAQRSRDVEPDTPRDRLYSIVRRLVESDSGVDVYVLADALTVSESTVEADLRRVRVLAEEAGLGLLRRGPLVRLEGSEEARRRLISRMFRDESAQGVFTLDDVQREFASPGLGAFKTELLAALESRGYYINDYGVNSVLLHIAIAVDRVSRGIRDPSPERPSSATHGELATLLAELVERHFATPLTDAELAQLGILMTTRVATPGQNEPISAVVENYVDPEDLSVVRELVAEVNAAYLVDLDDEGFIARLALHVRNLVARAGEGGYSRNPLTRSIKTSYPMTYEIAVFLASGLQRRRDISVNEDEIAYIALHVGSFLERVSRREERLSCVIVCPNYYDLAHMLRLRVERSLGTEVEVRSLITRSDVDWSRLTADLVITTIDERPASDEVVLVQPFLTDHDVEAVRRAIARVRRHRRRTQIKDELLQFFDESLFFRNLHAGDEAAMIRLLGERMIARGIIDADYVEGAIDRERMSSTAFTDTLAVPHAMVMSARRTSIAIVVNDTPMQWGEQRVNVIAMIAFASEGRSTFQTVFDQFVEVFSERAEVQRLIRRSVDFGAFIEELVRVFDS
ncbi:MULTISPECIES: BglG family transcription antiterminator [unclassified Rathayibacter]|uniref:BglG family transcription antiterminator n=1 Tax=unclassified Rathayibacter TaxID=2609250 RepID=UPI00188A6131|nr:MULTISPECIES: PTS sugar transporter subunit IIA [unclassified Rathayibacter]MBF4461610.1 transcription antiterminator [Rathayibacter sp. VKM Ac-2879]MBF4503021.1 transcription antiterminator [Rathayibacter sp. VKM Ac-2878]